MTAHQGFRVAATTAGITSSPFEHLRVNYVYGGDKTAEDDRPGPPPGSPKSSQARAERMAVFAAARARGLSIAVAGREAGVTPATAKTYKRMLEQQGGSDA